MRKLIYTGKHGSKVIFPKGVDVTSPDGIVRRGDEVIPYDDGVAARLVKQGTCQWEGEDDAPKEPEPAKKRKARVASSDDTTSHDEENEK